MGGKKLNLSILTNSSKSNLSVLTNLKKNDPSVGFRLFRGRPVGLSSIPSNNLGDGWIGFFPGFGLKLKSNGRQKVKFKYLNKFSKRGHIIFTAKNKNDPLVGFRKSRDFQFDSAKSLG